MSASNITGTRIVQRAAVHHIQEITVDICVVGSGVAGVTAALEAARAGRKVALVEGSPAVGGQAVNSIIGTFAGLVSNGPNPYLFTYGVVEDMLRALGAQGKLYLRRKFNTIMYDEVALGRWYEKELQKSGVLVLLGAVMRGVNRADRRIKSLELATKFGDLRLHADGFVDASGDATLAWMAGLPCREPEDAIVYGTHVAVLEGVDESRYPKEEEIVERLKEKGREYGVERTAGIVVLFPGRGICVLNMTHVETPLEPVAASQKALEGKDQADLAVEFLTSEFPEAFGNANVRSYGWPGVRQTRWIKGSYQLTVEDVRNGTWFPDAIARTAWPLELHHTMEGYLWEMFSEDHVHYIPLRSLTPPDVDNLAAAGRCIDGDLAALSSVRVMGPGMATGAAAAHALSLAGKGSVHEINIAALQERLKDNLYRKDPYPGTYSAR